MIIEILKVILEALFRIGFCIYSFGGLESDGVACYFGKLDLVRSRTHFSSGDSAKSFRRAKTLLILLMKITTILGWKVDLYGSY